ncbi:unnamed protein product [Pylaiella littoralis]
MTARSSVAATFGSASSLSLPASSSVDTFSAVQHLSAPQFMAKSPSLVKARQGIAEATAIRGPIPPCTLTLRGKRQTRKRNEIKHDGNSYCDGGRAAAANNSPRRPPYRVDTGEGFSPRLRMLGEDGHAHGDKTTAATVKTVNEPLSPVLVEPVSLASRSCAADISATNHVACGATTIAVDTIFGPVTSCRLVSCPCRDYESPRERDLPVVSASEFNETTTHAWQGNQVRTKGQPDTREHPVVTSRAESLCGRLWTGTTASAKSDAVRPRIVFLVSGQQQHLKNTAQKRCIETRRHQQVFRVDPIVAAPPRPRKVKNTKPVPPVKREITMSPGWHSRNGSRGDGRTDQDGDDGGRDGGGGDRILMQESTGGFAADGESYDAATTAATDGRGNDSAKKVLHVRVPHLPPSSLLILRSAPPTE